VAVLEGLEGLEGEGLQGPALWEAGPGSATCRRSPRAATTSPRARRCSCGWTRCHGPARPAAPPGDPPLGPWAPVHLDRLRSPMPRGGGAPKADHLPTKPGQLHQGPHPRSINPSSYPVDCRPPPEAIISRRSRIRHRRFLRRPTGPGTAPEGEP
jgi:hypothetical protein